MINSIVHSVFGCSLNNNYVSEEAFELIRAFVSLPPATWTLLDQEVWYSVPVSQIARPVQENTQYLVISDFEGIEPITRMITRRELPRRYRLRDVLKPLAIDRMTIFHETVDTSPFTLKENAEFSDVGVHTRLRRVVNVYAGREWTWELREVYRAPFRDLADPTNFYFSGMPRYEVHLFTDGDVGCTELMSFLSVALPNPYNRFTPFQ